jgi:hypothetical protein
MLRGIPGSLRSTAEFGCPAGGSVEAFSLTWLVADGSVLSFSAAKGNTPFLVMTDSHVAGLQLKSKEFDSSHGFGSVQYGGA